MLLWLQVILMKIVIARIYKAVRVRGGRLWHLCYFYTIGAALRGAHDSGSSTHQAFLCLVDTDFRDCGLSQLCVKVYHCGALRR